MAGYVRQSTFATDDVVEAPDHNAEYNQLVATFSNSTGHAHDGTVASGPVIGLIGDAGVTIPLNKVLVDTASNNIGFWVDVSSSSVEQVVVQDGALIPVVDNDIDLGSPSLQYKDGYVKGIWYVDTIAESTAAAGVTIDGVILKDGGITLSTPLTVASGGTGAITDTAARTSLGLAIGSDVQAFSSVLGATTASFTTTLEANIGTNNSKLTADTTNVNAAGATMNTDTSISGNSWFLDDDTMAANSATKAVSQQSLVAYVASQTPGLQTITLTGNVTGSGTGSFATTIANDAVTYAKMQNIPTDNLLGRTTSGTGNVEDLTATQVRAILNVSDGANNYTHSTNSVTNINTANAEVIDVINTSSEGHVTSMSKRTMTLANLGYTGATNAEANPALVGQSEAEAGVATTERIWSAQRVKQAIEALGMNLSVQRGQNTLGATGQANVTISAVDLSKSFITLFGDEDTTGSAYHEVSGYLSTTTNLVLRGDNSELIYWEVVTSV